MKNMTKNVFKNPESSPQLANTPSASHKPLYLVKF